MIKYYKIYLLNSNDFLGVVSSIEFRTYLNNRYYIASSLKDANCFVFKDSLYRAPWMKKINELKNAFPTVDLFQISKEEYDNLKEEK